MPYPQYALEWLEDHGIIRRSYQYGPRDVAGRVIEIVIDLAGKDPTNKPPSQPRPTPPGPAPGPPQPPEATPGRRLNDPPTAEEILTGQAVAATIRQAIAQSRQETAPPVTQQRPPDRAQQERTLQQQRLRSNLDSINRRLDQARRLIDADKDPVVCAEIARLEEAQATLTAEPNQTAPARE